MQKVNQIEFRITIYVHHFIIIWILQIKSNILNMNLFYHNTLIKNIHQIFDFKMTLVYSDNVISLWIEDTFLLNNWD